MASTNIGQKFSQTYPATTLYWHTCKFTRKLYASPDRRRTYSAEGERLKREHDQAIKDAAKQTSRVYFYFCPVGQRWFCARTPWATTPESKEARRIKDAERAKAKREQGLTLAYEESRKGKRIEYLKAYHAANREEQNKKDAERARRYKAQAPPKPEPTSCPVYFNTCTVTGELFTARTPRAKVSNLGRLLEGRAAYYANRKQRQCACRQCGKEFTPAVGSRARSYCGEACADLSAYLKSRSASTHKKRAEKFNVLYNGSISAMAVFERGNWTCYICGMPTPKALRGKNEPGSPEIDHIIPMSRGGGHVLSNVACSCRRCNGMKGNRSLAEVKSIIMVG